MRHFDLPFGEGLNFDDDVVVEGPLVFNIKLGSDLRDFLNTSVLLGEVNMLLSTWTKKMTLR